MLWAIFPVLASVFYCIGSYIQNHLTDHALPKKRAGSYIIMHIPCYIAAMVLLLIFFGRAVFMLPMVNIVGLIVAGAINVIGSLFYYRALQAGDTIDITIFNQTSPLISLLFGFLLLGKGITANQAIGLVCIMSAALIVILGGEKKRNSPPNLKVAAIVIVHAIFSVLSDVVYKKYIGDGTANFTLLAQGFFYFELGSLLLTSIVVMCSEKSRKAIKKTFFGGKNHSKNLALSMIDAAAYLLAEFLYKIGLLLAPVVALVTAVGKAASLFASFFMNMVLGRLFPKVIRAKKFTRRTLFQYLFAGVIIMAGIIVMN